MFKWQYTYVQYYGNTILRKYSQRMKSALNYMDTLTSDFLRSVNMFHIIMSLLKIQCITTDSIKKVSKLIDLIYTGLPIELLKIRQFLFNLCQIGRYFYLRSGAKTKEKKKCYSVK